MASQEHPPGPLEMGVLDLLTQLDPYGLTPGVVGGAPAAEYDIEARPIARLLASEGVIMVDQIDEIWRKWFGERLTDVVAIERVNLMVVEMNDLALRYRQW